MDIWEKETQIRKHEGQKTIANDALVLQMFVSKNAAYPKNTISLKEKGLKISINLGEKVSSGTEHMIFKTHVDF